MSGAGWEEIKSRRELFELRLQVDDSMYDRKISPRLPLRALPAMKRRIDASGTPRSPPPARAAPAASS